MSIRKSSQRRSDRRGSIVVLVAISLVALLAFVAIAVDGGGLMERRRSVQATADAAALSAAGSLFLNYPSNDGYDAGGDAAARARATAAANGYGDDRSLVTVRVSPQLYLGGPNKGTPLPPGYVETTVQFNQQRRFSAILGSGALPVAARAVARGQWEPSNVGIHVLDLYAKGSLNATGTGVSTVTGGASIVVNSNHPEAAITNGGTLTAARFDITGGTYSSGNGGGFFGDIRTGVDPTPDPLRHIPAPVASDYATQSMGKVQVSNGSRTLRPGIYHGGITISGQGNVTLEPGVYYMSGGGFQFGGQGSLTADGVMIYSDPKQPSDNINISGSGNGAVRMTPPTSGTYKGLTLFQRRTAENQMNVSGNGAFYVTGTFYTANALLTVSGGGDSAIGSQYISRYLEIVGNANLLIDYAPERCIPRRVLGLVE